MSDIRVNVFYWINGWKYFGYGFLVIYELYNQLIDNICVFIYMLFKYDWSGNDWGEGQWMYKDRIIELRDIIV